MKQQCVYEASTLLRILTKSSMIVVILLFSHNPTTTVPIARSISLERASSVPQDESGLTFYESIDIYVPAGKSGDFHFDLDNSTAIGIVVIGGDSSISCHLESIDGKELYKLRDAAPPGICFVWWSTGLIQVPLQTGRHVIRFDNGSQDSECHSVLYMYPIGVPINEGVNEVAIGNTYEQRLAIGSVNVHLFQVTDAPRTINIYSVPVPDSHLQPVLRLYPPDGMIDAIELYNPKTRGTHLSDIRLTSNGWYAITVQDWNHDSAGEYQLAVVDTPPLVLNVGEAKYESLPYFGLQEWMLNIEPDDLPRGNVECIAYSLVAGHPTPYIAGSLRSATNFQSRDSISAQPGTYEIAVFSNSMENSGGSGGIYVLGCADVGQHRTIGIGGDFRFKGDYFTRFLPAIAGLSALFSLRTDTNRNMQLELWYEEELIAHAAGRHPSFDVVFPENGIYTVIGRGAPGTSPEVVYQDISIEWINNVLPSSDEVEPTPTVDPTPTTELSPPIEPTPTTEPSPPIEPTSEPGSMTKKSTAGLLMGAFCVCSAAVSIGAIIVLLFVLKRRRP